MAKLLSCLTKPPVPLGFRKDLAAFCHKDAPSGLALQHPVPDEFLIGAGNCIGIDDEDSASTRTAGSCSPTRSFPTTTARWICCTSWRKIGISLAGEMEKPSDMGVLMH